MLQYAACCRPLPELLGALCSRHGRQACTCLATQTMAFISCPVPSQACLLCKPAKDVIWTIPRDATCPQLQPSECLYSVHVKACIGV